MNLTYPICIDDEVTDWYRNYAVKGQSNSEKSIGFEVKWSLEIRREILSTGVKRLVNNHEIAIL